jgi:hypothetical protein
VVKVFFFVIVGTLLRPPFLPMLVGVFIALVLIGVRPLGVKIGMFKSPLLPADLKLVNICAPRGLAAGVLATIPFTQGVTGVEQLSTTVFAVIVTTIVVFAVLFAKLQNEIPAALTPSVEKES